MNQMLVTLAALAMSAVFAFRRGTDGLGRLRRPGLSWNGVFLLEACVSGRGWVDSNSWNDWGHWGHGIQKQLEPFATAT